MNAAMMTRSFVSCGFPGVQCGFALDKADLGKVFQVFVHLFQQMNHFTKGSPLGDTLSLSCEASVGTSGSNN